MKSYVYSTMALMLMLTLVSCDMPKEENSLVMGGVVDRMQRYTSRVDLAPGESTSGWMVFQRQTNKQQITMYYFDKFINVPPDLVFKFSAK